MEKKRSTRRSRPEVVNKQPRNGKKLTYRQQRLLLHLPRPPVPDLHALDLEENWDGPVDRRGEAVVDEGDLRERDPEAAARQWGETSEGERHLFSRREWVFRRHDFLLSSLTTKCRRLYETGSAFFNPRATS